MSSRANQKLHLGVIGGGAWGTALACVGARRGHRVLLWAREPSVVQSINRRHRNPQFLPRQILPRCIFATGEMEDLGICSVILAVCPAQHMEAILTAAKPHLARHAVVVLCAKGIGRERLALMPQLGQRALPKQPLAILSGPSFADEVARGLPAALTLASRSPRVRAEVQAALQDDAFRLYTSSDMTGVALGGAVKNVLAIACGIADGRALGANARAALIARGLAEMARLGEAMGARRVTLMGLSGLGDLVLTCSSRASRNFSLGRGLGQGRSMAALMRSGATVKEGALSARALVQLAERHKVEMPICRAVAEIVEERASVAAAMRRLLQRPTGAELA